MTKRVHVSTVNHKNGAANPQNAVGVPNPWERLAMRKVLPSIFAQDPHFARGKQITNTSEKSTLDLGVLSPKGEAAYLLRTAPRRKNNITITKRRDGEIPQALRSNSIRG